MTCLVLRIYICFQLPSKHKLSILIQSQTSGVLLSGMYGKEDFGQKCAASTKQLFLCFALEHGDLKKLFFVL